MKKILKVTAIAAIAVCLVGLGSYARNLFFAQATAWYVPTGGGCVAIVAQTTTPFAATALGNNDALISNAISGSTQLYSENTCTTKAEFNP